MSLQCENLLLQVNILYSLSKSTLLHLPFYSRWPMWACYTRMLDTWLTAVLKIQARISRSQFSLKQVSPLENSPFDLFFTPDPTQKVRVFLNFLVRSPRQIDRVSLPSQDTDSNKSLADAPSLPHFFQNGENNRFR